MYDILNRELVVMAPTSPIKEVHIWGLEGLLQNYQFLWALTQLNSQVSTTT